ncbi:hypothetical protein DQ04_01981000 [Trypanosoma grayi]|uniref:hypothetical protein n=1 Tax=Trypanosoma grayi TaxID=71804 RepID=UPI0004F4995D|nr:hypothetical protein DQ04_01981000 [Trypanosoma grayi]KEG12119.1 hypothetical protein DQ04_01981000 [Trypanosoma grayi]
MSVTVRYTRAELLSLAPKPHEITLTAGALQKFKVIETEPLVETTPVEPPRNESASSGGGGGGGGSGNRKGEGKNGASGRRTANNDRFAPPSRGWRGSRDQEAFEEGYKYELERNAIKKQALQETMAREQQKSENAAEEETKAESKEKDEPAPAKEEAKVNYDDEMERLMTSIGLGDGATKKVTKSRFFSGAESGNKGTTTAPLATGQSFMEPSALPSTISTKDQWPFHAMVPTSGNVVWNNVDAQRASGIAGPASATNGAVPTNVVVGSVQSSMLSGVSAPSSVQMTQPSLLGTVPSSTTTSTIPSTAAPAPASEPSKTSPITQARTWNAQELEQMLLSGQMNNKQTKQEAAKGKPIDASALESQLLQQVQQNTLRSHTQQPQPQPSPHAPVPGTPSMSGAAPAPGTPPTIPTSGQRTPPQVSLAQPPQHIPQQQPMPLPWGMTMQKVPPQQLHQKLMQPQPQHRHHGIPQPVPIIMSGAQGAPYYAQQTMHGHYVAGFVPGQGQQPMVVYRSADGTTQYAMGATGFPPNAQILFPPQQQQQQQRR